MIALILFNFVSLAVALLIGFATGRWMFAGRPPAPPAPSEEPPRS
jgi:hypothetical protein